MISETTSDLKKIGFSATAVAIGVAVVAVFIAVKSTLESRNLLLRNKLLALQIKAMQEGKSIQQNTVL